MTQLFLAHRVDTIDFPWALIVILDEVNFNAQIKAEDGSLFEKIIAECIGGIAQTIFNFTTGEDSNVGFKDYDTLIFNNNKHPSNRRVFLI